MSKSATLLGLLEEAGVDVRALQAAVDELDAKFGGEVGDIPEGALQACVDGHLDGYKLRKVALLVGRLMEAGIAVPEDRKWEKGPKAAEEKRNRNLAKAGKK